MYASLLCRSAPRTVKPCASFPLELTNARTPTAFRPRYSPRLTNTPQLSTMATASSLPIELIVSIIKHTLPHDRAVNFRQRSALLRAFALIARDWRHPAQQLLFHSIYIGDEATALLLLQTMEEEATLAARVRKLLVASAPISEVHGSPTESTTLDILRGCTELRTLDLLNLGSASVPFSGLGSVLAASPGTLFAIFGSRVARLNFLFSRLTLNFSFPGLVTFFASGCNLRIGEEQGLVLPNLQHLGLESGQFFRAKSSSNFLSTSSLPSLRILHLASIYLCAPLREILLALVPQLDFMVLSEDDWTLQAFIDAAGPENILYIIGRDGLNESPVEDALDIRHLHRRPPSGTDVEWLQERKNRRLEHDHDAPLPSPFALNDAMHVQVDSMRLVLEETRWIKALGDNLPQIRNLTTFSRSPHHKGHDNPEPVELYLYKLQRRAVEMCKELGVLMLLEEADWHDMILPGFWNPRRKANEERAAREATKKTQKSKSRLASL